LGSQWELQWNTLRTEEKSLSPTSLGQGYEIMCGAIKKICGNTMRTCFKHFWELGGNRLAKSKSRKIFPPKTETSDFIAMIAHCDNIQTYEWAFFHHLPV
jgi:hypothetical protein